MASHKSLSDSGDNNKHRNITLIPKWITLLCLAYVFLGATKKPLAFTITTAPLQNQVELHQQMGAVILEPNVLTACVLHHCYPCFVIK